MKSQAGHMGMSQRCSRLKVYLGHPVGMWSLRGDYVGGVTTREYENVYVEKLQGKRGSKFDFVASMRLRKEGFGP